MPVGKMTTTTTAYRRRSAFLLFLIQLIVGLSPALAFSSSSKPQEPPLTNSSDDDDTKHRRTTAAIPIDPSGWPDRFPAKDHCSKCGLCETSFVSHVTEACAFLGDGMARMDDMEERVHGRRRDVSNMQWSTGNSGNSNQIENANANEEARFGVLHQPIQLAKGNGIRNAQWTGCVTGIAVSMLESGMVDAVVCIAAETTGEGKGWSSPEPILAKSVEDVLRGRGVKPALAPSLRVLDDIASDDDITKLLFCGVGCAVQAFRAVQDSLKLEAVYVLGTNCADNSPTPAAAKNFIEKGVGVNSDSVQGYEFMQDFKVHVKTEETYVTKPYFVLPGTIAESSIATSCLSCFDYTNGLADVVVGYMGAPLDSNAKMDESYQTLTIRNAKGLQMVQTAVDASRLHIHGQVEGSGGHEKLASATLASDSIVLGMLGKNIPDKGMPGWMGEIMAKVMVNVGPKGINFARYSIDYHILRNYLHVVDEFGEARAQKSIPLYAQKIVRHYIENDRAVADLTRKVK